jgi:carbamoyltransferase
VAKVKESHLISVDENDIKNINSIRSTLPAITHIDKTARVQTIDEKRNPNLYTLLTSFYTKSKVPVLVNTSFNVRGEPPVLTPEDAYLCFMETELDILVIHNFLLIKEQQPNYENKEIWKRKFDVD